MDHRYPEAPPTAEPAETLEPVVMDPRYPDPPPFLVPDDRQEVTQEPPQVGVDWVPVHNDREWIGTENMGGGYVPPEHTWTSNPKQDQDDLSSQ